jgi:glutathionyl-hydroquinone reductase
MGLLVDGEWQDTWYNTKDSAGQFKRAESSFRNWITPTGDPGISGEGGFAASPGRYHLYVSLACPWAHRTLIMRRLKALEKVISVSAVHWLMLENGWEFKKAPDELSDPLYGSQFLHQIYTKASPQFSGRVTVPVLWDKQKHTIVSNESSEILRMLNDAFEPWAKPNINFYPIELRNEIDRINTRIYHDVNNGVYKAGFATTQPAYDDAVHTLFSALEWLEDHLKDREWLCGDVMTEADIRLFTTLVRFDAVYVLHFKCNIKRLIDFKNLSQFLLRMLAIPEIAETQNLEHIRKHYHLSHKSINPHGILPAGPANLFHEV